MGTISEPKDSETRGLRCSDVPCVRRVLRCKGTEATCRAQQPPCRAPSPQIPTYRMNPVSVVIVSPGTTKCFLVSRSKLSLRGLRATGSLISIAILAPKNGASAVRPGTATSGSAIPCSRLEGRGGAGLGGAANGNAQPGGHVDYWQPLG